MKETAYICHTYYHVYVSILKEFARPENEQGKATIILSTMSNDFESLKERLQKNGYFADVLTYEEQPPSAFPELAKYKKKSDSFIKALFNRIIYTKKLGKYEEKYIPVDLRRFDDLYVFCDSDPIGYYLNRKHIFYHAVEDGLNTLRSCDAARADNVPHFGLKSFFSKYLNLIFVQNGYGKYCLDMEVNDISVLNYSCPYYVEVSRTALYERLTEAEKQFLLNIFVKNREELQAILDAAVKKTLLILTEPLCEDLNMRKQLFGDLISKYEKAGYEVILKQHPRDMFDYKTAFPDQLCIDRTVPMEMLNFFKRKFTMVVSVFTELDNVYFAENKLRLGRDFMDAYEDREIHEARFESKRD